MLATLRRTRPCGCRCSPRSGGDGDPPADPDCNGRGGDGGGDGGSDGGDDGGGDGGGGAGAGGGGRGAPGAGGVPPSPGATVCRLPRASRGFGPASLRLGRRIPLLPPARCWPSGVLAARFPPPLAVEWLWLLSTAKRPPPTSPTSGRWASAPFLPSLPPPLLSTATSTSPSPVAGGEGGEGGGEDRRAPPTPAEAHAGRSRRGVPGRLSRRPWTWGCGVGGVLLRRRKERRRGGSGAEAGRKRQTLPLLSPCTG